MCTLARWRGWEGTPVSEPKLYRILQISFIALIVVLVVPAVIVTAQGNRTFRRYWRGLSALDDGDYEAARRDIEWYVERRPFDQSALFQLARVCCFMGDYQRALELYDRSLEGDEPRWWHERARSYMEAMAEGKAPAGMRLRFLVPDWERPQDFWPADNELHGARDLGPGSYAEAARLFEACVDRMPDRGWQIDARWGAAIAWFHAGEYEACLEMLDAIEAEWGVEPSDAFERIRRYVRACSLGQVPDDEMPLVLAAYAPYPM
jgi:hypothetical protein